MASQETLLELARQMPSRRQLAGLVVVFSVLTSLAVLAIIASI